MLGSFWEVGAAVYTAIVIIVNLKMFYFQSNWWVLHYVALAVGVSAWVALAFGVSYYMSLDFEWYNLFFRLVTDRVFWATCVLCVVAVTVKDFVLLVIKKEFYLSQEESLQELQYLEALNNKSDKSDVSKVAPSPTSNTNTPPQTPTSPSNV